MKRLSNYEKVVFVLSIIVAMAGLVGIVINSPRVIFSAVLILVFLLIVAVVLSLLRLERSAAQQKRTREEVYQVLYTLQGSDQLTEHQARKTRDHVLRQHEALHEELIRITKTNAKQNPKDVEKSADSAGNEAISELAEEQRLRFNNLVAILDSHWEVLEEDRSDSSDPTFPRGA